MKNINKIVVSICFLLIIACSKGSGYRFVQDNFQENECQSMPSSSFENNECVDKYNDSYGDYEKNRREVVEENK